MASITSELWPSLKSTLKVPQRTSWQDLPRMVASRPRSVARQQSTSINFSLAESNVSLRYLRLFGLLLIWTEYVSARAAGLLSISALSHSHTSTLEMDNARRSAINYGNHPYVTPAGFLTYIRSPVQLHPRSFIVQIHSASEPHRCHGPHGPTQRYHRSNPHAFTDQ